MSIITGQTASFTALATGTPAPAIRWQAAAAGTTAFADVSGEPSCAPTAAPGSGTQTASTCTVSQTAVGASGRRLRAVATNTAAPGGVASTFATLTINPAPVPASITLHPSPQSTQVDGSATFSVGAAGTAPLNFVWRINGVDLPAAAAPFTIGNCRGLYWPNGAIATVSSLSLGCHGLSVTVFVSNGIGPGASSNPVTLSVDAVAPSLPAPPTSQAVGIGQTATFAVQASGESLNYQWMRSRAEQLDPDTGEATGRSLFEDIAGATGSSYTTPAATLADDRTLFAVRVCSGAPLQPFASNCVNYGLLSYEAVQLTINEVVSQNFAVVASGPRPRT